MHAFARALATVLLDGPQSDGAMLDRLTHAFDGRRPWMERLVRAVLHGGDAGEEQGEEEAWGDEEEWADEVQKDEPRDDASVPDLDRPRTEAMTIEQLADALLELHAFHAAVYERPLVRRWSAPPEMRESSWRVPALATPKELAVWLGIAVDTLTALADVRGISRTARDPRRRHYRYTWVAKQHGHRLLEAPKRRLRTVQRYVLDGIVAQISPHRAAHGFRAGHSIRSFAAPHVGRDVVIRLDLQAFFTSVFAARVASIFRAAGYPARVAQVLAALCTHRTPGDVLGAQPQPRDHVMTTRLRSPHLPQGAPTSGALANLSAYGLDVRVSALAASVGAAYSRYADDLVISGSRDLVRAAPTIIARIGAIALEEGFSLNFRKTRVLTASQQQRVTGLVINEKLSVPRAEIERLRAILHNCARTGPAAQNRDGYPDFRAHLLGRISWVESVDSAKGARLRALFETIRWDGEVP